eukprot:5601816-Amphidinium_carterae.2
MKETRCDQNMRIYSGLCSGIRKWFHCRSLVDIKLIASCFGAIYSGGRKGLSWIRLSRSWSPSAPLGAGLERLGLWPLAMSDPFALLLLSELADTDRAQILVVVVTLKRLPTTDAEDKTKVDKVDFAPVEERDEETRKELVAILTDWLLSALAWSWLARSWPNV